MSNLGMYQRMTVVAKKVGGPINLALLFGAGMFFSGFMLCKFCEVLKKEPQRNQEYATEAEK